MLMQKIAQGLHHLGFLTGSGQAGSQAVEAQDIEQHPQKRGRNRLRRCEKTLLSEAPLHSRGVPKPAWGTCTENDISERAVGTASSEKGVAVQGRCAR